MASNMQIKEHIYTFGPIIQKYAKEYGYKVCSPIIAQSITETVSSKNPTGWSVLKIKYHNMFGMKCGSWKPPQGCGSVNLRTGEEYTPGTITMIRDNFRTFPDYESGIKRGCGGYFDFINTKRYANLKEASTPAQYLNYLKADGYATSSTYVTNNLSLISKYKLDQFDNIVTPVKDIAPDLNKPTLKLGMTDKTLGAPYILAWQNYLNLWGYKCNKNGVYDTSMKKAVIQYQKDKGIAADSIIGPLTWATVK